MMRHPTTHKLPVTRGVLIRDNGRIFVQCGRCRNRWYEVTDDPDWRKEYRKHFPRRRLPPMPGQKPAPAKPVKRIRLPEFADEAKLVEHCAWTTTCNRCDQIILEGSPIWYYGEVPKGVDCVGCRSIFDQNGHYPTPDDIATARRIEDSKKIARRRLG